MISVNPDSFAPYKGVPRVPGRGVGTVEVEINGEARVLPAEHYENTGYIHITEGLFFRDRFGKVYSVLVLCRSNGHVFSRCFVDGWGEETCDKNQVFFGG